MKNSIKIQVLLVFTIALMAVSCEKEKTEGTVSGKLNVYDLSKPLTALPAEGIKVCLIDRDFNFVPSDYKKNLKAIVDSAFTNKTGEYSISGIPEGNFAVVPMPADRNYYFAPENESIKSSFSISRTMSEYKVNFKSPIPGSENIVISPNLEVTVNIKNCPSGAFFKVQRETLSYGVTTMSDVLTSTSDGTTLKMVIRVRPGRVIDPPNVTETNNFLITAATGITGELYASFRISWPDITLTPLFQTWEIDWTSRTINLTSSNG